MSSLVGCWVWDQITKLHLSDGWAPELSATINPLVRGISGDLDSLATKPLQRLLVGLCHSELDGGEVAFTLRVLLAEMLGGAVLLIGPRPSASIHMWAWPPKPDSPEY